MSMKKLDGKKILVIFAIAIAATYVFVEYIVPEVDMSNGTLWWIVIPGLTALHVFLQNKK